MRDRLGVDCDNEARKKELASMTPADEKAEDDRKAEKEDADKCASYLDTQFVNALFIIFSLKWTLILFW